jgi:hypothetical protein
MCNGIFCLIRIPYTLRNSAIDAMFVDTSLCNVRCCRPEKNQIMLGRDDKMVQVQNMNMLFSTKFNCADVGNFWGHLELC